ncbi:unnamed protein product [Linum trigynum]|uniref:30S ribosomal protein S6 alpha, chloroplastic n=1 Tax=Linum trigynum TaxID=586398 RepID=A0AAV2DL14_9ROSI
MASSAVSSTLFCSPICCKLLSKSHSSPSLALCGRFPANATAIFTRGRGSESAPTVKAQTFDFSGSFYQGGGMGSDEEPPSSSGGTATAVEEKEAPPCPPGLRQYETMAVLRPDMSEDDRLTLTQKYEELLVAGGGMYVEVFNRGVIPLAYSIRKKNKAGETNTYLDGIYLLFTYFTKPDSMTALESILQADDDVIRSSSFKFRKRRY